MPAIAVTNRPPTAPDGVLVQEAAAGSGTSYAALYDRHAQHVYNYCVRLTGSPEDAADATQEAFLGVLRRLQDDDRPVLDFSSYLFAAARNESYALMRRRSRVEASESPPEERGRVGDVETEPERALLLRDTQESVRVANAQLAPRHREVLALRELNGRSYDEIGRIMGVSENGAAQLIWRARSKLREAMTAGAVASVVAMSAECERAQLLLSRIQDGELVDDDDRDWLDEHLDECGSCRSAKGMLLEVGSSYRCWLPVPIAALAALKMDTLAAAGTLIGADWSGAAAGTSAGSTGGGASTGGVAAAAAGGLAAVAVAVAAILSGGDSGVERRAAQVTEEPAMSEPAKRARTERAEAAAASPALAAQRAARLVMAQAVLEPSAKKRVVPRERRRDAPREKPAPRPDRAIPPESQPRQQPSGCTWPGGGGGPGGCPPGHGGVPPGKGGTPPGQAGGQAGKGPAPQAEAGAPPGHGGTPPGHGGFPPGRVGKS